MNIQFHGALQQARVQLPPPPPPDSVSLNPGSYNFGTAGSSTTNVTVVTSSSGWSAQITSDPNGIIASLDIASGDSGQSVWMTSTTNSTQHASCAYAIIRVTCGTAYEDLSISQDGYNESCS